MKRRTLAMLWIAGATVPLLAAALFLVGCCVLPFHGLIHKMMPLCQTAAETLAAGHHDGDHHDEAPATPARQKEEPVKRLVSEVPRAVHLIAASAGQHVDMVSAKTSPRSFISHGAARCDQDIGLHLLVGSLLI